MAEQSDLIIRRSTFDVHGLLVFLMAGDFTCDCPGPNMDGIEKPRDLWLITIRTLEIHAFRCPEGLNQRVKHTRHV
jgi:hypothetical protein